MNCKSLINYSTLASPSCPWFRCHLLNVIRCDITFDLTLLIARGSSASNELMPGLQSQSWPFKNAAVANHPVEQPCDKRNRSPAHSDISTNVSLLLFSMHFSSSLLNRTYIYSLNECVVRNMQTTCREHVSR